MDDMGFSVRVHNVSPFSKIFIVIDDIDQLAGWIRLDVACALEFARAA